jgi:hypothetical protein
MDMDYHTRGDVINGHLETGYQAFHPGSLFRNWKLTLAACRGYDFGGNRINENYIFNAEGEFLNYLKSMRGTVVIRREYRPGSTFFIVWTQNRADYSYPGQFDFSRDIQALFNAPGDHIFLIKINHRMKL